MKIIILQIVITFIISYAIRHFNLVPKPSADYKPNAMVFITLFWNEEDKQRTIESGYKKFGIFLIYDGAKKEEKSQRVCGR